VVGDELAGVFLGGLVVTEPGVAGGGVEDPLAAAQPPRPGIQRSGYG